MLVEKRLDLELLTRTRWGEVLLRLGHQDFASRQHPRERRGNLRCLLLAVAKLTLPSAGTNQQPHVYAKCPILDASATGLAIKSYQRIATGTVVTLELFVGDMRLTLSGTVVNCTGFPGCYRIGVTLSFVEQQQEERDVRTDGT